LHGLSALRIGVTEVRGIGQFRRGGTEGAPGIVTSGRTAARPCSAVARFGALKHADAPGFERSVVDGTAATPRCRSVCPYANPRIGVAPLAGSASGAQRLGFAVALILVFLHVALLASGTRGAGIGKARQRVSTHAIVPRVSPGNPMPIGSAGAAASGTASEASAWAGIAWLGKAESARLVGMAADPCLP
jgi:hypothetical protein